jgi:hypothetical protein
MVERRLKKVVGTPREREWERGERQEGTEVQRQIEITLVGTVVERQE